MACQFFTNEYVDLQSDEEDRLLKALTLQLQVMMCENASNLHDFEYGLTRTRNVYTLVQAELVKTHDRVRSSMSIRRHPSNTQKTMAGPLYRVLPQKHDRAITPIKDETSQAVRSQYEESPYPRWQTIGLYSPRQYQELLLESFATYEPPVGHPVPVQVLNAGCGTGRHAIMSATRYSNCEVLAIDLSLSSLAYAKRSAKELELSNIVFQQADILELGSLNRQFDLIECGGVLHHIADTTAALKVLVDLLRPGGVIMIALYSEIARENVHKCTTLIHENGFSKTADAIRRARQAVIELDESHASNAVSCNHRFLFAERVQRPVVSRT